MTSDPVFQNPDDGTWWFWDETWTSKHRPYLTEQRAREACIEYARRLDETT